MKATKCCDKCLHYDCFYVSCTRKFFREKFGICTMDGNEVSGDSVCVAYKKRSADAPPITKEQFDESLKILNDLQQYYYDRD